MYNNFFGFQKTPFDIVPNPDLLYMSQRHKIALDHLEFGLMSGAGFILLTGEIGTGKTTLIRNLIRSPLTRDTEIAMVFHTNVSAEQLLNMILTDFELPTRSGDKAGALDDLYNFFMATFVRGRKVLIIVDEAQNLGFEALEELRMLTNLQSDDRMLLQVLLVGQPELKQKLMDPKLTQFAQRIAVNYHLSGLSPEETKLYVSYRLLKVDGSPDLFSPEALSLIHEASGGIPRTINLLCGGALLYTYADERTQVTENDVQQVIEAKFGLSGASAPMRGKRGAIASPQTAPIKPQHPTATVKPKKQPTTVVKAADQVVQQPSQPAVKPPPVAVASSSPAQDKAPMPAVEQNDAPQVVAEPQIAAPLAVAHSEVQARVADVQTSAPQVILEKSAPTPLASAAAASSATPKETAPSPAAPQQKSGPLLVPSAIVQNAQRMAAQNQHAAQQAKVSSLPPVTTLGFREIGKALNAMLLHGLAKVASYLSSKLNDIAKRN